MQVIHGRRLPTVTNEAILGFFDEFRFLSNYHLEAFELDGLVYPSSEHAYAAQKTSDPGIRAYIAALPSPKDARLFGGTLPLPAGWKQRRVGAMRRVLRVKFASPELRAALLATGDRYLEETNDWGDTFWGVVAGIGENQLGKLLMQLREEFRRQDERRPRRKPARPVKKALAA